MKMASIAGGTASQAARITDRTRSMFRAILAENGITGTAALDVADRQNAHSMTIAVRGVVELLRLVGREKELHQEVLAFLISHDDRTVRIYGHYPVTGEHNKTYITYFPIA